MQHIEKVQLQRSLTVGAGATVSIGALWVLGAASVSILVHWVSGTGGALQAMPLLQISWDGTNVANPSTTPFAVVSDFTGRDPNNAGGAIAVLTAANSLPSPVPWIHPRIVGNATNAQVVNVDAIVVFDDSINMPKGGLSSDPLTVP